MCCLARGLWTHIVHSRPENYRSIHTSITYHEQGLGGLEPIPSDTGEQEGRSLDWKSLSPIRALLTPVGLVLHSWMHWSISVKLGRSRNTQRYYLLVTVTPFPTADLILAFPNCDSDLPALSPYSGHPVVNTECRTVLLDVMVPAAFGPSPRHQTVNNHVTRSWHLRYILFLLQSERWKPHILLYELPNVWSLILFLYLTHNDMITAVSN